MKNNTEQMKNNLFQALANSPDDFNLLEVKRLIIRAIDIVENVEKKRQNRENNAQKRKESNNKKVDYLNSLSLIDHELNLEKSKLEELQNKKKLSHKNSNDEGDEVQNVFG